MRKCRNWQTSKTKDLVSNALVWVQVPSSALVKSVGNLDFIEVSPFFVTEIIGYTFQYLSECKIFETADYARLPSYGEYGS